MIDLDELTSDDIGQWVQYRPGAGNPRLGRIKSWSAAGWVFVVYACDDNWNDFQNYTGCATDPDDLEMIR